jgi:crossover junction endodeoxyribonuclease RuvC
MIVGVDPGAHGAFAFLSDSGALISVHDMPSFQVRVGAKTRTRLAVAELAALIRERSCSASFIERVGAMPGQGVSSCFSFGYSAGAVEGVLAALGVAVNFVTPQQWKKAMQVRADKDDCRQRAAQLFPSHAGAFSRVKDDGRAEAAMIALYGFQSAARIAA